LKTTEASDNELLKKSSLNIALLPENEEDIKLASLLRLRPSISKFILYLRDYLYIYSIYG
jgi:hypothetical protein